MQRQGLHVLVVIVLHAVTMAVVVIMMMIMVVMMMLVGAVLVVAMFVIVVMLVRRKEFRLQFENAIEIERAALQHVRQRHLTALGPMQFGVRVDRADTTFDFRQFVR